MSRASSYAHDLPLERQWKNLLFDFYGALLTARQREVFSLHHMDDLSLTEIGEMVGTSPQAVLDMLKRTSVKLGRYEEKLGLVGKYISQKKAAEEIGGLVTEVNPECSPRILALVDSMIL